MKSGTRMTLKMGINVSEVPHEYRCYLGVVADWHLPGYRKLLASSAVSGQVQRKLAARVLPLFSDLLGRMDEEIGRSADSEFES